MCLVKIFSTVVLVASLYLAHGSATHALAIEGGTESNAAKGWAEFSRRLEELGYKIQSVLPDDRNSQQRAELNLTMAWIMSQGLLQLDRSDPKYPDWVPLINVALPFGAPNPDTIYYGAQIDGEGVYRIAGRRGTVQIVDIQINDKFLGIDDTFGNNLKNINLDDLRIAKDGTFELILSSKKPRGYDGNWVRLDPTARYLMMRQISLDWKNEIDAQVGIQRLDIAKVKPRASEERIEKLLSRLPLYVENWIKGMIDIGLANIKQRPVNDVAMRGESGDSGTNRNQVYYSGRYVLDHDEALILEFTPPEDCNYWSIQLMDLIINSLEYGYNQTSLNKHTAFIDSDKKVRFVITKSDPGIANWLEALHDEAFILGRYYRCSETPLPTVKKVNSSRIMNYLPPDTKRVTPQERMKAIQLRVFGSQLRRRW